MQASIGQYSIHAGEPEQPVQQSVVIARMRGRFFRVALPSPCDIGQYLSTMSYICCDSNIALRNSSTICVNAVLSLLRNVSSYKEHGLNVQNGRTNRCKRSQAFLSHENKPK